MGAPKSVVKCVNDYLNRLVEALKSIVGNNKCRQASCIRGNNGLRIQGDSAQASRYHHSTGVRLATSTDAVGEFLNLNLLYIVLQIALSTHVVRVRYHGTEDKEVNLSHGAGPENDPFIQGRPNQIVMENETFLEDTS